MFACLVGGGAGAVAALWLVWPDPAPPPQVIAVPAPPHIEIHQTTVPIVLPVPVAVAPPADATRYRPGSCPEVERGRHSWAGSVYGREPGQGVQIETATAVAVSSSLYGVVAAHDGETVWLSRDDGRSFETVLAGPGRVVSVDVDCFGRVFALRDSGRLGVRDDAGERWHRFDSVFIPGADDDFRSERVRLAANGGYVAVIGPRDKGDDTALVAISADAGISWRYRELSFYDNVADLRITGGGVLRAILRWSDCMIEGLRLAELDLAGGPERVRELDGYYVYDVRWGSDGWIYTTDENACSAGVCAMAPGAKTWRDVRGVPALDRRDGECPDESEGVLASGHGPTYVRLGGEAYRVTRGRGRAAGDGADVAGITDPQGRVLTAGDGPLVRWSRYRGTYVLHGRVHTD